MICGLGNSPPQYHPTRHNAGWLALDKIIQTHKLEKVSTKLRGEVYKGKIATHKVLAFYPETLMNGCGQDISAVMRFYRLPLKNLLVIHDEIDLPLATLRVKTGGSSAGHNGIKSIDNHLSNPTTSPKTNQTGNQTGGNQYLRLRIGIGRGRGSNVNKHVLGKFTAKEAELMEPVFTTIANRIGFLIGGSPQQFFD